MKKSAALAIAFVLAVAAYFSIHKNNGKAGDGNVPASFSLPSASDRAVSPQISPSGSAPVSLSPTDPLNLPTPEDQRKFKILTQILVSKNDNDPRLDQDFNQMTSAAKDLFMQKYRETAPEKLNEKGTIVFLLGRNLSRDKDFDFLKDVLAEPPCRSLIDCSKEPGPSSVEDLHHDLGTGITLAYPKLNALFAIERYLKQPGADPAQVKRSVGILEQEEKSSNPRVAQKALQVLRDYSSRR